MTPRRWPRRSRAAPRRACRTPPRTPRGRAPAAAPTTPRSPASCAGTTSRSARRPAATRPSFVEAPPGEAQEHVFEGGAAHERGERPVARLQHLRVDVLAVARVDEQPVGQLLHPFREVFEL